MIEIKGLNIAGLYILLKKDEKTLDGNLKRVLCEFEKYLYDRLSVQELENLQELYKTNDFGLNKALNGRYE